MRKYIILFMVLVAVIVGLFLYSNGYFSVGDNPEGYGNKKLPDSYPQYLFPVYKNGVVNEVVEGKDESVTISFLNKESQEEIKSYYRNLLKDAYQISEKNDGKEYTSFGMKSDFVYSISVTNNKTKYKNVDYNTITTVGVMPMDDEFKNDMANMTEKEKEVMLIWFKAVNEMNKND